MMLNTVLAAIKRNEFVDWSKVAKMWLVCDCGPHFRSYENTAHFLFTLVKGLQIEVNLLFLAEQHGKGACDRLFGWTNEWLTSYLQRSPVHGLASLIDAYRKGSERMMREDPSGPKFLVQSYDPGKSRPGGRVSFQCPGFKVTRTYSLSAKPSTYASSGVSIRDNVFTDLTAKQPLTGWSISEITTPAEHEVWRRGYYDKPRAWEAVGPQAGDVNELTRKFLSQKTHRSANMPQPKRSLEEKLSAHARTLSKASVKKRRQLRALRQASANETSSSSSSSSSESTSSDDVSP